MSSRKASSVKLSECPWPNPDFASRCDTLFETNGTLFETNGLFGRIQRRLGHRDAFVVWLREWVAVE